MGWEYELETDIRYLQGVDKGKEQGIEITNQEANLRFVTSLLLSTEFDAEKIAKLAGVDIEFVEKVKRELP